MLGEAPDTQNGYYDLSTTVGTLGKTDALRVAMFQWPIEGSLTNNYLCGADQNEWCLAVVIERADGKTSPYLEPIVRVRGSDLIGVHYQQDQKTKNWSIRVSINDKPAISHDVKDTADRKELRIINKCWGCDKPTSTIQLRQFNITLSAPDDHFGKLSGIVSSDQVSAGTIMSEDEGKTWTEPYVLLMPPI